MVRNAIAVVVLTLAVGCSSKPPLVAVTGTVAMAGKPASGMGVAFWPMDPAVPLTNLNSGIVFTDETGRFAYGSTEQGTGLSPGEYKLTFTRIVDKSGKPAPFDKPGEDGAKELVAGPYLDRAKTPTMVVLAFPATQLELTVAGR